jgi:glucokinase
MTINIGIDLGGTKIAAAAVDVATGEIAGRLVVPTEAHEGPEAVVRRIARVVTQMRRGEAAALGVGIPGVIDLATGQTQFLPNLPGDWNGLQVAGQLAEQTGLRTWLLNDARSFILAEATWGAGRGARSVVGMTLGTGIGGGIAIDGRLYLGFDGAAGEVGHQTIDPDGPPCGCGNRGCLEALASGPALAALGVKAVMQGMTTQISALAEQDLNRITPDTIRRAAEAGDAVARQILDRVGAYLGIGVGNLINILSPERVIIGGGVAQLGDWIFAPLRAEVRARCHSTLRDQVKIVPAALGGDAGAIGAAMWAYQRMKDEG